MPQCLCRMLLFFGTKWSQKTFGDEVRNGRQTTDLKQEMKHLPLVCMRWQNMGEVRPHIMKPRSQYKVTYSHILSHRLRSYIYTWVYTSRCIKVTVYVHTIQLWFYWHTIRFCDICHSFAYVRLPVLDDIYGFKP